MSILINMEMPKNCGDCKAFVCYRQWAGDVGDCFCGITKNDAEAKKKNVDCPLVPVPPHGRLIDADELMELYADTDDLRLKDMKVPIAVIRQNIMDMPTIIPADQAEEGEK